MVVEVVLAGNVRAGGLEDAAQGITHRGPAGAAQVDGARRVRGDELQVDLLPGVRSIAAEFLARGENLGDNCALSGRGEADVEESRSGDGGLLNGVVAREGVSQPLRQFARLGAGLLGHLEGQVGGVVAVLRITRALNGHGLRQHGGVQLVLVKHSGRGLFNQDGKIFRIHRAKVYRPPAAEAPSGRRLRTRLAAR